MATGTFGDVGVQLLGGRPGAILGDVGALLFVARAALGDVGVALLVAGAAFGDVGV